MQNLTEIDLIDLVTMTEDFQYKIQLFQSQVREMQAEIARRTGENRKAKADAEKSKEVPNPNGTTKVKMEVAT